MLQYSSKVQGCEKRLSVIASETAGMAMAATAATAIRVYRSSPCFHRRTLALSFSILGFLLGGPAELMSLDRMAKNSRRALDFWVKTPHYGQCPERRAGWRRVYLAANCASRAPDISKEHAIALLD
jgi:hypothetical protein